MCSELGYIGWFPGDEECWGGEGKERIWEKWTDMEIDLN